MNNLFFISKYLLAMLLALSCTQVSQAQTLDSLPPLDSLPAEQLAGLASQLFIQAKNVEADCATTLRSREAERTTQEENLRLVRQDTSIEKAVLDSLIVHLKTARAAERTAAAQLKKAQKAASLCEKTAVMEPTMQRKNLPKAWKEVQRLKLEVQSSKIAVRPAAEKPAETKSVESADKPTDNGAISGIKNIKNKLKRNKEGNKQSNSTASSPTVDNGTEPSADSTQTVEPKNTQPRDKKTDTPAQPKFATYDPAQDVMLHPPTPPCQLAVNTRDEFTGATLRQTRASELFHQTPPALRAYLEGRDQIVCQAAIATAGQNASLLLTFQINDPNTRRAFGNLPKNSFAMLTFTDGTALNINNSQLDEGTTDPDTRLVIYRAQYPLDATALRKIRSTELDRLRIAWSTGYEDYGVQQVDALMQQAKCLSAGE